VSWTEIDPVSAELEMSDLLFGLVRMLKPEVVVETGTYRAHTARVLGRAVRWNGFGHVYTCDIEMGVGHLQRIQDLPVTYRETSSLDLAELRIADFVFSDSAQAIRTEEYALVKPGCVFVVHDTAVSHSGNEDQFWLGKWVVAQGGLNFNAGRGFGILQKPLPISVNNSL
jgi:hypothetical protein